MSGTPGPTEKLASQPTNRPAVIQPTELKNNFFFNENRLNSRPSGVACEIAARSFEKNPVSAEGSTVRFKPQRKPARRPNGSVRPPGSTPLARVAFDSLESRLLL